MGSAADGYDSGSASWHAKLSLKLAARDGRTVLAAKRQQGPLTVQRAFYPEGEVSHIYLLHPPGGVVGGDRLEVDVQVGEKAHALITTPGAAKIYRSAGAPAVVHQHLSIADDGVLEWFPHESILFPGARLRSRTEVELGGAARFLGWEVQSYGRPVIGERFNSGSADLGLRIQRDGRPLILDRLRLRAEADLDRPSGLRGHQISATFAANGASPQDLEAGRASLGTPQDMLFSMTLIDDLLVARCLAQSVEPAHRIFVKLWGILRPRLLNREACAPRIWAT